MLEVCKASIGLLCCHVPAKRTRNAPIVPAMCFKIIANIKKLVLSHGRVNSFLHEQLLKNLTNLKKKLTKERFVGRRQQNERNEVDLANLRIVSTRFNQL